MTRKNTTTEVQSVQLEVVALEVLRDLESEITAPLQLGEDTERRALLTRSVAKLRLALQAAA